MRRMDCQSFTRAYPIPNGTASIMSSSCPNGGGSDFRADTPSIGADLPCTGAAEGMPDSRRAFDAGPRAYVYRDSTQTPGGFSDRVSERQERDCNCPAVRQGAEVLGRAFLGPRLCRVHRRL